MSVTYRDQKHILLNKLTHAQRAGLSLVLLNIGMLKPITTQLNFSTFT